MILQALVKYYEDLERQEKLPKQGWCQAKWIEILSLR